MRGSSLGILLGQRYQLEIVFQVHLLENLFRESAVVGMGKYLVQLLEMLLVHLLVDERW